MAEWARKRSALLAIALTAIATLRIVATYDVFSHTFDEPMHVACGMEWLDRGTYTCEPQHPPLARIAAALGPYLSGIRSQGVATSDIYSQPLEGIAILYAGHHYERTLSLARAGALPFFWLACWVVYAWGLRYGRAEAVLSVLMFSVLPPVLAHAGLATTDMALTATLGAAFLAAVRWAEAPTIVRSVIFGFMTGCTVLAKFSSLLFLPAAIAAALIVLWATGRHLDALNIQRLATLPLAILTGALLIWAGYRFAFGPSPELGFSIPSPSLAAGIASVMEHNERGHWSYLLGHRSPVGFWYFYPVALFAKTPLPYLAMIITGTWLVLRSKRSGLWVPLVFSAAILQAGMLGHINIGIRHVLPVYLGASILTGNAVAYLARGSTRERTAAVLLLGWLLVSSGRSHPDYIAYFNEAIGNHPEDVLVDSDLDWGQDIKRLGQRLREVGATSVVFPQFIVADLHKQQGFPPVQTDADLVHPPTSGYFAAGATFWKALRFGLVANGDHAIWPDNLPPTERIGRGMFLWRFDPTNDVPGKKWK